MRDGGPDGGPVVVDAGASTDDGGVGLEVLWQANVAASERGRQTLLNGQLGAGLVPLMAMRSLWVVWGGPPPGSDQAYWSAFATRYGLVEGGLQGLPFGMHVTANQEVALDCLTCHAARLNNELVVGAPNTRFDVQGLFDDLAALARVAPNYGFQVPPLPYTLVDRTHAAGANDAMGLGLELALKWAPGATIQTRQGFQRPPAWWTLKHKRWHYVDGSAPAGGYRMMMATLLASRLTLAELQAQDATFRDLGEYLLSLRAPRWPFAAPEPTLVAQGRAVFDAQCAGCHGHAAGPSREFPDRVVPRADIGTDPVRAASFTSREVDFINASWFGGDAPMRATGGYLAPALTGVWATAPYLHNGSVPTLEALLDSSKRPASFQLGSGYDELAVGWTFTVVAPRGQATLEARRVYDTAAAGLSNAGHTVGDALSPTERRAVLEYLKTL